MVEHLMFYSHVFCNHKTKDILTFSIHSKKASGESSSHENQPSCNWVTLYAIKITHQVSVQRQQRVVNYAANVCIAPCNISMKFIHSYDNVAQDRHIVVRASINIPSMDHKSTYVVVP